jgi:hypothetical protein
VAFLLLPSFRPRLGAVALALLLASGATATGAATPGPTDANQVKAAFLVNFLKFVEWEADRLPRDGQPFIVAVLNDPAFGGVVARAVQGQSAHGHPISVHGMTRVEDLVTAHLVFIPTGDAPRIAAIARTLEGRGVLTVGDTSGFAQAGVVLNLYVAGDRVRFEANTAAAARARVRLSSQLLKIARLVG